MLLWFSLAFAQTDWNKVEIKTEQVTDNIYVLYGAGGNIGVVVGEDYVYMIDDQFAQLTDKISTAIAKISTKPIQFVINTHWHADHTGGNENLGKSGAVLIAHDNVRKRLSSQQQKKDGSIAKPQPNEALPKITFNDNLTLYPDSLNPMHAIHVEHAHTDGDVLIYFPESNVLHMGDVFFNGLYPYIDTSSGGSINGLIKAVGETMFFINDETVIIPGHGKIATKKELVAYLDFLTLVRDRVKKEKDKGKTLEEAQQMGLTKEWDETHGKAFISPDELVESVYISLK